MKDTCAAESLGGDERYDYPIHSQLQEVRHHEKVVQLVVPPRAPIVAVVSYTGGWLVGICQVPVADCRSHLHFDKAVADGVELGINGKAKDGSGHSKGGKDGQVGVAESL